MTLSRSRIKEMFLRDAERARQRKELYLDQRIAAPPEVTPFSPLAGAAAGFLTGGPVGAVAGGLGGLNQPNVLQAGLKGGMAGLQVPGAEGGQNLLSQAAGQFSALAKPENLSRTAQLIKTVSEKDLDVPGFLKQRNIEEDRKTKRLKTQAATTKLQTVEASSGRVADYLNLVGKAETDSILDSISDKAKSDRKILNKGRTEVEKAINIKRNQITRKEEKAAKPKRVAKTPQSTIDQKIVNKTLSWQAELKSQVDSTLKQVRASKSIIPFVSSAKEDYKKAIDKAASLIDITIDGIKRNRKISASARRDLINSLTAYRNELTTGEL